MGNETKKEPSYCEGTAAGFKGNSTEARKNSAGAAREVNKTLPRRHREMMAAWEPYGAHGAIPEEIAESLGLPVHVVRPRAGELVKRGLMFEVGRRMGGMGHNVTAYSTVRPPNEVLL